MGVSGDMRMRVWLRRPTLIAANGMLLLALAGQAILSALYSALPGAAAIPYEAFVIAGELLFFAPPMIYAARRPGVSLAMRLKAPEPRAVLFPAIWAIAAFAFTMPLNALWADLLGAAGGSAVSNMPVPDGPRQLAWSLALIAGIPAICEEALFRGAILGAWERRGAGRALFASASLFALAHGRVSALPTLAVAGFALGYCAMAYDTLCASVSFHAAFNAIGLIAAYLAGKGEVALPAASEASAAAPAGPAAMIFAAAVGCALFLAAMRPIRGRMLKAMSSGDRPPPDKSPMGWHELTTLIVALITAALALIADAGRVFGGL